MYAILEVRDFDEASGGDVLILEFLLVDRMIIIMIVNNPTNPYQR